MTKKTSRRGLLAGVAGTATTALAGCASITPLVGQRLTDDFTIDVDGNEHLSVTGDIGAITVRGADREDIAVEVVKQSSSVRTDLEDLTVQTERDGSTLAIRTEYEGNIGWMESQPSADLDIWIPRGISVDRIEASVGRIDIRDVTGEVDVESTTGRITVEHVDGSVAARSTTGRIELSDVSGHVSAVATTGRIRISNVESTGDVSTSTGRIDVEIPAIEGDTRIQSQTGRITAAISPDMDADIRASSNTGRVSHDALPLTDVTSGRQSVSGQLGEGGPTITFQTSTGRITLDALA